MLRALLRMTAGPAARRVAARRVAAPGTGLNNRCAPLATLLGVRAVPTLVSGGHVGSITTRQFGGAAGAGHGGGDVEGVALLQAARLGIGEGMQRYAAGNFAASEHVFRRVLSELEAAVTGHSREHQIFLAAVRLNLANSLREQYLVDRKAPLFAEGDMLYQSAVKSIRAIFGENHLRLSKALRERALLLQAVGDAAATEDALRDAIAVHITWCKVNDGVDSVQEVDDEREVRVVECRERIELLVLLAKTLKAQGKTAELTQLEAPIYKCIEYVEMLDPSSLLGVLHDLAAYQKLAGVDDEKTQDAITMLKAEALFSESLQAEEDGATDSK